MHDTPQQNGVAERIHGTVFQAIRSNLTSANLPTNLWGECLTYVLYVYNRTPHAALDYKSPYEARFGNPPDLSNLHPFGQSCVVRLETAEKLTNRGVMCKWLAPDELSSGYRVYWPKERKVSTERNLRMLSAVEEEVSPDSSKISDFDIESANNNNTSKHPANLPADDTPNERPKRQVKPTKRAQGITYEATAEAWLASGGDPMGDPLSFAEVNKRPDVDKWYAAADIEAASLMKHGTLAWEYVTPPPGANLTGLKFVFRTKKLADGSIDKYKARLVVQGFTQIEGIDYYADNTRSPVARLSTICAILAFAAKHDWEIHQINVKSAYLYGELNEDEEIYA